MDAQSKAGGKGRLVLKSNLNVIIAKMEQTQNRRLYDSVVAKETNLSRATVRKYRAPHPIERIDASAVTALCDWAGIDDIGELLYVERESA